MKYLARVSRSETNIVYLQPGSAEQCVLQRGGVRQVSDWVDEWKAHEDDGGEESQSVSIQVLDFTILEIS